MSNDAQDKQERPERQPDRQPEHVKRAQGEINANVSDYTEHVTARRLEKKLSGNSGATGQLPDQNGKGLASAQDLLGDNAHGLSKKEKQAALLAQVEKDGYIVGKPQEKTILVAEKLEEQKTTEQNKEKLVPKDGDHLTLKQLLNDYKTPFIDAYEHSKHLKDGEPGKSKTLEEVVDRLKPCPWTDQIWIDFKFKPDNPEYSNEKSTITIDTSDSPQKQIENFAHEAFHATHQFLSKQYDSGKISQADFVNTWLNGEVSSMLVEAKVHQDLHLGGEEPRFKFVSDGKMESIKIADFVKEHGQDGFKEFLRSHQPTGRNAEPYGQHYAKSYDNYLKFFEQNKSSVNKLLETWVKSGHKRDQL